MAWSLAATDNWGVTARLNVDFRRPVALGRPIRAEGWVERGPAADDRDRGPDRRPGERRGQLATAEATYVAADAERKRELQERYRFRLVRRDAAPVASARRPATAGAH